MAESKISEIIATSLSEIKNLVDANTIIGEPINTPSGTVIIPVSKITMGLATGGVDFGAKDRTEAVKKDDKFSGGGGTGVSVTPVAFLVVKSDGKVSMINVEMPPETPDVVGTVTGFIEKSPDIVAKFKDIFAKGDKE
jgi:sporulation protein YtfJ